MPFQHAHLQKRARLTLNFERIAASSNKTMIVAESTSLETQAALDQRAVVAALNTMRPISAKPRGRKRCSSIRKRHGSCLHWPAGTSSSVSGAMAAVVGAAADSQVPVAQAAPVPGAWRFSGEISDGDASDLG